MVRRALATVTFLLALATLFFAHKREEPASAPRLPDLEGAVVPLMAERWSENSSRSSPPEGMAGLKSVEIRAVHRADCLLTGIPVSTDKIGALDRTPLYLVHATAEAQWWKLTTEHLVILGGADGVYTPLLHFDGGGNWKGLDFDLVDVGHKEPDFVLVVQDYGCGNQMSQTRTHIFRWDEATARIDEVFNELTTFLAGLGPGGATPFIYKSEVRFESADRRLKDVVVTTELRQARPGDEKWTRSTRISRFRWNGACYVGGLDVPRLAIHRTSGELTTSRNGRGPHP